MTGNICPAPSYEPLIHFHEPKYSVGGVHQFWNTISNFWYLAVGIQLCRRRSPIGSTVICIGIFSALFHASGHLIYEIADEVNILILVHIIIDATRTHDRANVCLNLMYPVYFWGIYIRDFRVFYIILTVVTLIALINLSSRSAIFGKPDLFRDMITCFAIGKFFWLLEQCGYFWFGHAIWHTFSAFAIGYAGLIVDL